MSRVIGKALKLVIYTACRSNEVLGATWDEIDLSNKDWTIPAERMKGGKEHRVECCQDSYGHTRSTLQVVAVYKVLDVYQRFLRTLYAYLELLVRQ